MEAGQVQWFLTLRDVLDKSVLSLLLNCSVLQECRDSVSPEELVANKTVLSLD